MKYFCLLIFTLLLFGCGNPGRENGSANPQKDQVESESISGELPMLVEFSAIWCGPCQKMKPIFEDLEMTYGDKITFRTVDIDKDSEMAEFYHVTAVPTFIFFNKNGEEVRRVEGLVDQSVLENQINTMIK